MTTLRVVTNNQTPDVTTRKAELVKFLTAVLSDGAPISLSMLQDGKRSACRTFPASDIAKLYDGLVKGNSVGFDIYFTVNRVASALIDSNKWPTNLDITAVHALVADLDDPEKVTLDKLRSLSLPPSLIVESSPGKYQVYWLVENTRAITVEEFTAFQQLVIKKLAEYGADPKVKDLRRVLRLPGFHHVKAKDRPITAEDPVSGRFVSRLREANGRRYSRTELVSFFGEPSKDDYKHLLGELTQADLESYDLAELDDHSGDKGRERLEDLVSTCEYLIEHGTSDGEAWGTGGTWEMMTAAFARFVSAEQLKEEAINHYDELCQKSAGKYDEAENFKRLYSFAQGRYSGKKLTAATIINMAEKAGWLNPRKVYSKGYRIEPEGVYRLAPPDSEKPDTLICGRLIVSAFARDVNGDSSGLLLSWKDKDGKERERPFAAKRLYEDEKGVIAELADGGLYIDPANTRGVLQYLANFNTDERALAVTATGWQGECFVLAAGEVLKPDHITDRIVSYEAANSGTSIRGTLGQWQASNAQLCVGNPVLSFAVSTAFVAPLLEPMGAEGFGFHYQGKSSSGKSTALMLASSVYGKGSSGADGYCASWNGTVNAIETLLPKRSGLLLALDELSQANDARTISSTIMALGNGSSKGRLTKDAKERGTKTFRTAVLSSGERTPAKELERLSKGSNAQLDAGHEVRLPSIRVSEFPKAQGCFHNTQGKAPAEFAGMVKTAAVECYGAAGRKWLEYLVANRPNIAEQVERYRAEWLEQYTGNRTLGAQQMRVARNFALVAAAGELATCVGITGWKAGAAAKDTGVMFDHYLDDRGETEVSEKQKILDAVKHSLLTQFHRFQPVNGSGQARVINRLGFYEDPDDLNEDDGFCGGDSGGEDGDGEPATPSTGSKFYIKDPKQLEELAAGFDHQMIAKTLADAGFLELPSKDKGFQKAVSVNASRRFAGIHGRVIKFYVITGNILG